MIFLRLQRSHSPKNTMIYHEKKEDKSKAINESSIPRPYIKVWNYD